jgi:hypothetical protein
MFAGNGESRPLFTIHEDVITQRSKLLRTARQQKKNWKKSKASMLKDEDPQVFSAYLHTVYFGVVSLKNRTAEDAAGNATGNASRNKEVARFLIDLYLLADKLLDSVTANMVIDEILSFFDRNIGPLSGVTPHVYASTADGSPLRMLVRNFYIHEVNRSWPTSAGEWDLPTEFLQDFALEICRLQQENPRGIIEVIFEDHLVNRREGHYHQKVDQQ